MEYKISNRLKMGAIIMMVLGLLGVGYGFMDAHGVTEDNISEVLAAEHHGHGDAHASEGHGDTHAQETCSQCFVFQRRNYPLENVAFSCTLLFAHEQSAVCVISRSIRKRKFASDFCT